MKSFKERLKELPEKEAIEWAMEEIEQAVESEIGNILLHSDLDAKNAIERIRSSFAFIESKIKLDK